MAALAACVALSCGAGEDPRTVEGTTRQTDPAEPSGEVLAQSTSSGTEGETPTGTPTHAVEPSGVARESPGAESETPPGGVGEGADASQELPAGPALDLPALSAPSRAPTDEATAVALFEQGDVERAAVCFSDVALGSPASAQPRGYEGLVHLALGDLATRARTPRDCGDPLAGDPAGRRYANGRLSLLWAMQDTLPCLSAAGRTRYGPLVEQVEAELVSRCGPLPRATYVGHDQAPAACGPAIVQQYRGLGVREARLGMRPSCPDSASAGGGLGSLGSGAP